jgi:hypothetical protein
MLLKLTDLDVNEDEKLVMQLWNHFLMSRRVISHAQLHQACKDICKTYGGFIKEKKLRRNFLLHLLNLVDHCLIKPSKITEIMEILDNCEVVNKPDFTGILKEQETLSKIVDSAKTAKDYNYFL